MVKDLSEWPFEKQGEKKSSLSRTSPLTDNNINIYVDGVLVKEKQ
jgi:hypothetical protein